eukprot:TRINITY_DN4475_c0_g1_i1.p1 TRINITY_DN4475_c0_g1~~TRINITY_DN4475_c0_g1_i1.p1  ORF type:complete len:329 (-),score=46.63 TRINITY_DN4475_c0_g1_i1:1122-2108(-)
MAMEGRFRRYCGFSLIGLLLSAASAQRLTGEPAPPPWMPEPRLSGPVDFTLTTQTTLDRARMLMHICERWTGPISAAVLIPRGAAPYLAPNSTRDHGSAAATSATAMMATAGGVGKIESACPQLRVRYVEDHGGSAAAEDYPVNRMRNLAIEGVRTSHYVMVDVDLWPREGLYEHLHATAAGQAAEAFMSRWNAFVVPAFEKKATSSQCKGGSEPLSADLSPSLSALACWQKVAGTVPKDISDLAGCLLAHQCSIFYPRVPASHGSTNYTAWTRQSALRRIPCFQSPRYEPYLIVPKGPGTPAFDERFTGYGKNKIAWTSHLRYLGFR